MKKKHLPIVITCGDPAGVGPEVALSAWKALRDEIPLCIIIDPDFLPKNIDIESDQWDLLLNHAKLVKDHLILLQKKHKSILDHFEFKDGIATELLTRNKLLSEVREFLNTSKSKEYNTLLF